MNNSRTIEKNSLNEFLQMAKERIKSEGITPQLIETIIKYDPNIALELLDFEDNLNSIEEPKQKEYIKKILREAVIFISTNNDLNLIRDAVSSSKNFTQETEGGFRKEITNSKGEVRGIAEIRTSNDDIFPELPALWAKLVQEALSSLDELTADLFDLILYLWSVTDKDEFGYMTFDSDFALSLRYADPNLEEYSIRERERFTIMKRIAALSGVWISTRQDNVKVLQTEDLENSDYNFAEFMRMFDVTSIKMAYDKVTHEPKGIYSLRIRPAPIIESYLKNAGQLFGPLDVKVFSYHHVRQRVHKRLTRYLNSQWKIRAAKRKINMPFKVETLVKACDFAVRMTIVKQRESLEETLSDLMKDGVLESWHYENDITELEMGTSKMAKKWLEQYIYIQPSTNILNLSKQKMYLDDVINAFKFPESNPAVEDSNAYSSLTELSATSLMLPYDGLEPEEVIDQVNEIIEKKNISIRSLSGVVDIPFSTLRRYLSKELLRYKKPIINKLYVWCKQQTGVY